MSETLILLELADGVCAGPRHLPAKTFKPNGKRYNLAERIKLGGGIPPETWAAECGAVGMLFVDAPILSHRAECFACRVEAERERVTVTRRQPSVPYATRYETEEQRNEARRRAWRESKRRQREAA